ncbi:protein trapped in endoderm-1 isoform X2 [Eurytemora carolleeae]|uniref:protein trapped in endoderm-1 isoform X2 n=1 Tax=Eurytemora carolleeae TaxID=1294199 RepID=UPI000C778897|nr:protein trapped in endoderm-1 isoform X2 [Eurytemora carolleeae]|eukprot:XP_023336859.1 protein trapped in endoderm-1-like isoform X2 [Eurytemora affinis]
MDVNFTDKCAFAISEKSSNDSMVFSESSSLLAGIFAIILAVVGTCLNLLFILALLFHRRTRAHLTTPFMLSDFWNSLFNLPIMAVRFISRDWMGFLGFGICEIYPLSFYGTMGASLLSLTIITVNRAFILFFPNKVDRIFSNIIVVCNHNIPTSSILILLLCWLVPTGILLLPTTGVYGEVGLNDATQSCTLLRDEKGHTVKPLIYLVGFILPCVTLFVTNIAE